MPVVDGAARMGVSIADFLTAAREANVEWNSICGSASAIQASMSRAL